MIFTRILDFNAPKKSKRVGNSIIISQFTLKQYSNMQINFYQTDGILHKSIAPILTKILEEEKRALIFCTNQELLKQLDDGLWSFSKTRFIPHGTKDDEVKADKQPILLSQTQENLNNSSYLIMLDKADDDFIKKFDKVFYFFGSDNLKQSKDLWRYYKEKSAKLNFYKREQDKWISSN
jgi:DNA polymerase IIIc chi subunit